MRLFVALALPAPAREALGAWAQAAFASDPALRAVAADNLHVTLAFLGRRDGEDVERVAELVRRAAAGLAAASLTVTGVTGVPKRRTRLFAAEVDDPGGRAATVQGAVARALAGAGLYDPEDRPFWPHITLARVRKGATPEQIDFGPPPELVIDACEVVLYRSDLSPRGATYTPLATTALRPAT